MGNKFSCIDPQSDKVEIDNINYNLKIKKPLGKKPSARTKRLDRDILQAGYLESTMDMHINIDENPLETNLPYFIENFIGNEQDVENTVLNFLVNELQQITLSNKPLRQKFIILVNNYFEVEKKKEEHQTPRRNQFIKSLAIDSQLTKNVQTEACYKDFLNELQEALKDHLVKNQNQSLDFSTIQPQMKELHESFSQDKDIYMQTQCGSTIESQSPVKVNNKQSSLLSSSDQNQYFQQQNLKLQKTINDLNNQLDELQRRRTSTKDFSLDVKKLEFEIEQLQGQNQKLESEIDIMTFQHSQEILDLEKNVQGLQFDIGEFKMQKRFRKSSKAQKAKLNISAYDDFDEQTNAVLNMIDDVLSDAPDNQSEEGINDDMSSDEYEFQKNVRPSVVDDEVLKLKNQMIDDINQEEEVYQKRTNGRSCQTSPIRIQEDCDDKVDVSNAESQTQQKLFVDMCIQAQASHSSKQQQTNQFGISLSNQITQTNNDTDEKVNAKQEDKNTSLQTSLTHIQNKELASVETQTTFEPELIQITEQIGHHTSIDQSQTLNLDETLININQLIDNTLQKLTPREQAQEKQRFQKKVPALCNAQNTDQGIQSPHEEVLAVQVQDCEDDDIIQLFDGFEKSDRSQSGLNQEVSQGTSDNPLNQATLIQNSGSFVSQGMDEGSDMQNMLNKDFFEIKKTEQQRKGTFIEKTRTPILKKEQTTNPQSQLSRIPSFTKSIISNSNDKSSAMISQTKQKVRDSMRENQTTLASPFFQGLSKNKIQSPRTFQNIGSEEEKKQGKYISRAPVTPKAENQVSQLQKRSFLATPTSVKSNNEIMKPKQLFGQTKQPDSYQKLSSSKLALTQGSRIPKKDIFEKNRKNSFISQQNTEFPNNQDEEEADLNKILSNKPMKISSLLPPTPSKMKPPSKIPGVARSNQK